MRRASSQICLFLVALCLVTGFCIAGSRYAGSQRNDAANSKSVGTAQASEPQATPPTQEPVSDYLYYVLKDPKGFMLARAPKGSSGQPLSLPVPLTLMSDKFGLAETDAVLSIQLSPDGRYLAIDGTRADAEQVWIYDTQSRLIKLFPARAMGNFLRWLPGGNQHTFLYRPMFPMGPVAAQEREAWSASMWRVDAVTGMHTDLFLGVPAAFLVDAAPSPDGSRIIYSTSGGLGMGSATWMARSDGSARAYLFRSTGLGSVNALFSWSPDGKNIAYERLADSATPFLNADLWLMNAEGKHEEHLAITDGGHGYAPLWSPDSRKLAFVVRTNPHSVQANVQGQALQSAIGVVDIVSKQTWLVATPNETGMQLNINPHWTGGGSHITFTALNAANRLLGGTPRYWSVPVASAQVRPAATVLTPSISHVVAAT